MDKNTILERLSGLNPDIPWTHDYDFGFSIKSIDPRNEKYQRKARSLQKIGLLLQELLPVFSDSESLEGLKAIDLACGEGGHSIALAQKGVDVTGIEGRDLYIERARFAADAMGLSNVQFIKGDVREIDVDTLGKFDIVIASGILHHLSANSFEDFLRTVKALSRDVVVIYTHVASELAVKNHRLGGPVSTSNGYEGYLFREHRDDASARERLDRVRASLDNTFSFWATPESLHAALRDLGFSYVFEIKHPHVFDYEPASYRPLIVAKV